MRQFFTAVIPLAIVLSCLQMFYMTTSLVQRQEEVVDDSSRQLQVFVRLAESHPSTETKMQVSNVTGDNQQHSFQVLPKRLITVFGLESSGTTLLTKTLAKAVGAAKLFRYEGLFYQTKQRDTGKNIQVQHISLPFGWFHDQGIKNQTVVDIDFLPPYECMVWPHYLLRDQLRQNVLPPLKPCSKEAGLNKRVKLPQRFNVNITSHVRWYQEHGVKVTAVVMIRGDYTHLHGKVGNHNKNLTHALYEDFHGKELIADAMRRLSSSSVNGRPPELIITSYETLMSLQKLYLFDLYKQLGIHSTYMPELENANKKYVIPPNGTSNETWWSFDPIQLKVE